MTYEFQSPFATRINEMLEYRSALGRDTKHYRKSLAAFDRFCLRMFPSEYVLTKELAFAWCNDASGNGGRSRADSLRALGRYLLSIDEEAFVIPRSFFPQKKAALPHVFSQDELQRFFETSDGFPCPPQSPILGYTIAVIYRLQYACGLRSQEVRLLRRNDVNFRDGTIYIAKSKFYKDRRLPVSFSMMELMRRYDHIAEIQAPGRLYFFQSPQGNAYSSDWLCTNFKKCWEMSGNGSVRGTCTPYTLRHNFATHRLQKWFEEGRDLEAMVPYLTAYMGHEQFSFSYYYLQIMPERLAKMDFLRTNNIIPQVSYEEIE